MMKNLIPSLLVFILPFCNALSSTASKLDFPTVALKSTGQSQLTVLDGGEWASVQAVLQQDQRIDRKKSTKFGYMTVVAGRTQDGERVVAMQSTADNTVYQDSIAVVPDKVSETDAISTYIQSLSAVHSVLPKADLVGGSEDSIVCGKVVVLGGSELACFAAEGLASLGAHVSLVSSGNPKVKMSVGKLDILKPSVGSSGTGFSSHLGHFDSLLDTICDERPSKTISLLDDEYDDDDSFALGSSSVLELLKSRHNCHTYVSTLTHCQTIVTKEGILGGPGQTDKYAERIGGTARFLTSPDCQPIPPPAAIGTTMETLFQKGVVFAESKRKKLQQQKSKSVVLRGWSLSDFWEHTSWPRDSVTTSRRFGLPVVEIDEDEDEPMISEAPYRRVGNKYVAPAAAEPEDDLPVPPKPKQENPFVHNVVGVQGMQTEIIDEELDCIMFLSAKFCKTCKQINPIYTRMARLAKDASPNISFVKTEASGKWGKELGRELEVDAVPSFVFFRNGERYGTPLSVSRLPSKKIDRALELLESGADWDPRVLKLES